MKCFICKKEEANPDVNINIDSLIWVARNYFDNVETLSKKVKEKPYYKKTEAEQTFIKHYSTIQDAGNREISNICEILGIDWQKLYTIARLARKWEQKQNWQRCFPANEHKQLIIKYLIPTDPFIGPEINYINYKINKKSA